MQHQHCRIKLNGGSLKGFYYYNLDDLLITTNESICTTRTKLLNSLTKLSVHLRGHILTIFVRTHACDYRSDSSLRRYRRVVIFFGLSFLSACRISDGCVIFQAQVQCITFCTTHFTVLGICCNKLDGQLTNQLQGPFVALRLAQIFQISIHILFKNN